MSKKTKQSEEAKVPVAQTTVTRTRLEDGTILETQEDHELHAKKMAAASATGPEEVNNG